MWSRRESSDPKAPPLSAIDHGPLRKRGILGNREHWATRETAQILTTPLLSLCLYHPSNHPSQMLTIHQTHKARYAKKSTYIHRQGCILKHMHSFVFRCYTACLCESLCFGGHSVYCISRFHKYADDHVHNALGSPFTYT